jgi:hypothetical protein
MQHKIRARVSLSQQFNVAAETDYSAEVHALRAADIHVLYAGGYHTEIALLLRAARDKGYQVQFVSGSGILATEEFGLIAGAASEGTLFTSFVDPRRNANATEVIERFRAEGFDPEGYTLLTYAAVQEWSQAAEAEPGSVLVSYETFAQVREVIECEELGALQVEGIAYPITAYRVVDLKANRAANEHGVRTNLPHLRLEAEPYLMSPAERDEAANALRRVLKRLSG